MRLPPSHYGATLNVDAAWTHACKRTRTVDRGRGCRRRGGGLPWQRFVQGGHVGSDFPPTPQLSRYIWFCQWSQNMRCKRTCLQIGVRLAYNYCIELKGSQASQRGVLESSNRCS